MWPRISKDRVLILKGKWAPLWAGVLCIVLLFAYLLVAMRRAHPALRFSILSRTNDATGTQWAVVEVANQTSRFQNYAYWAEVRTANGWATATNWDLQHPGRLSWISGSDKYRFALPAPEGASVWRLRFMRMAQPSSLEWQWYALVRRFGLKRVGLRDQPSMGYSFTDQMTR